MIGEMPVCVEAIDPSLLSTLMKESIFSFAVCQFLYVVIAAITPHALPRLWNHMILKDRTELKIKLTSMVVCTVIIMACLWSYFGKSFELSSLFLYFPKSIVLQLQNNRILSTEKLDLEGNLAINHNIICSTSPLINRIAAGFLGYTLCDTLQMYRHGKFPEQPEFVAHHLAFIFLTVNFCSRPYGAYIVRNLLFAECSTPFMHARWILFKAGLANSMSYKIAHRSFIIVYFVVRVVMIGILFPVAFVYYAAFAVPTRWPMGWGVIANYCFGAAIIPLVYVLWFIKLLSKVKQKTKTSGQDANEGEQHANEGRQPILERNKSASKEQACKGSLRNRSQ